MQAWRGAQWGEILKEGVSFAPFPNTPVQAAWAPFAPCSPQPLLNRAPPRSPRKLGASARGRYRRRVRLPALLLATSAAAVLLATGADAAADCKHAVRWTSDALLPLSLVRGRRVEADRGQCKSIWENGSRWHTLDRWGRVVGEVEYRETSRGGMRFERVSGSRGAGLFVRGPWRAPASAALEPDPAARASLHQWLGKPQKRREITFFQASKGARAKVFAVVTTPTSIMVAYRKGTQWHRAYREVYGENRWHPLYRLRAIVDMNGDGLPEVIYHFNEYADGRGFEVVLSPKRGGQVYEQTADNQDNGP